MILESISISPSASSSYYLFSSYKKGGLCSLVVTNMGSYMLFIYATIYNVNGGKRLYPSCAIS